MAIQPIKFLVSPSATATNGSKTITVTGNIDCSYIYSGTAIALGNRQLVEAVSGTKPDGSGNSVITLRDSWAEPTTTAKLVAFNTIEGLAEAIRRAREVVQASEAALSGNVSYMGDHSAATGNYPAAPGEGLGSQIYRISIAGTISEREYKVGELIYYDQYFSQWRSFFDGFGTAAQRNAGTGTADLPDNAQLNTRLGTTGNLGNAAQRNVMNSPTDTTTPDALMPRGAFGVGTLFKSVQLDFATDHQRFVIGLVDVTNDPIGVYSQFLGSIFIGRSNGVEPPVVLDVLIQKKYNEAAGSFVVTFKDSVSALQDVSGIRAVHFTYNGRRYAGIDCYMSAPGKDLIFVEGSFNGRVQPFMVPIYREDTGQILNPEIWNSRVLVDDRVGRAYNQWNILGAVTFGFNRPTGAVIESGSNPNGLYMKLANGWLVQEIPERFWSVIGGGTPSPPFTTEDLLYFPIPFVGSFPRVSVNFLGRTPNDNFRCFCTATNLEYCKVSLTLNSPISGPAFSVVAIGRWRN
jgi:hypothetical protein